MGFNPDGHANFSPKEIEERLFRDRRSLINGVLIPAIPVAFPDRRKFDEFGKWLSDELRVHPRNFAIRGSTLLGFSLTPTKEKLWVKYGPESDVDLAIVDPDYYHLINREIRHIEHRPVVSCEISGETEQKRRDRKSYRKYYCYRHRDLPDLPAIKYQRAILAIPPAVFESAREINAFVFRDWWSVFSRWDSDLRTLEDGLRQGRLPHGEGLLRPRTLGKS